MHRKVFLSVAAVVLLLSLCAVEAASKKKKNVRSILQRLTPCQVSLAMPCVCINTRMQTKSDVEKMQESCVQILAISAVVVVVVELANYFLSYRSQAFRTTASKLVSAVCCVHLRFDF